MGSLLLAVIYLIFISLGLPDSLLGSAWPTMRVVFDVPSSFAGYVSMTISLMTVISALISPSLIKKMRTQWIVIISIALTILGLIGFSFCTAYWMLFIFAIPYGLGAGCIDASVNHYVANHYSGSAMSFLHCFYGVGAVISPNIMALALKYARWNQGYRWTALIQSGILFIVILSVPLWKKSETAEDVEETENSAGIKETVKRRGVKPTLAGFFAYCAGEATCFLWTSSYFAGTKTGISPELIASFGSLIFGGLMIGRLISGFISEKMGDRRMIRIGAAVELLGILLVMFSADVYMIAVAGFLLIGIGMGPIYPSIQHMAPDNFGKRYSAAVIGMQMASAYVGSTLMPLCFGLLQQALGIWIMPYYVLLFLILNIGFLEFSYRIIDKDED